MKRSTQAAKVEMKAGTRVPGLGAPAPVAAKDVKQGAPVRRASFATGPGAWISAPVRHHRAGAARR